MPRKSQEPEESADLTDEDCIALKRLLKALGAISGGSAAVTTEPAAGGGDDDPLAGLGDGEPTGPTKDDVMAGIKKVVAAQGKEIAVKLLAKFGAKSANDLGDDKYEAFIVACDKVSAKK